MGLRVSTQPNGDILIKYENDILGNVLTKGKGEKFRRTKMRARKMVGVLALTAALAMGSVPAFATSSDPGTVIADDNNAIKEITAASEGATATGSSSTGIDINYDKTQINVAVPVKLVIGASNGAGTDLVCPSTGKYYITNNSGAAIYLTQFQVTESDNTTWKLFTASEIGSESVTVKPNKINLNMTVGAYGNQYNLADCVNTPQTLSGVKIANKGTNTCTLDLEGTSNIVAVSEQGVATNAFSVAYTIALDDINAPASS